MPEPPAQETGVPVPAGASTLAAQETSTAGPSAAASGPSTAEPASGGSAPSVEAACKTDEGDTGEADWLRRDARLLRFLADAAPGIGLVRLAASLDAGLTLTRLESESRLKVLALLKEQGLKLTDRQKVANALAKATKDGTLPPEGCARPEPPPPICGKCDGAHRTDRCPHFAKAPEDHPDARSGGRKLLGSVKGPPEVIRAARVIRQPGDGSCLFHSLAHGLADGSSAQSLRGEISAWVASHGELEIADSPLKDWIGWDSSLSVADYCARMHRPGAWGGGIEMAAVSHLKRVHVYVYEAEPAGGFRRISIFAPPPPAAAAPPAARKEVRVIYQGGVHYDALELTDGVRAAAATSWAGASPAAMPSASELHYNSGFARGGAG